MPRRRQPIPDPPFPSTRGADRVSSILEAAEATFAELGYERATMRDIADRAGASMSSVYHFFDGKDALARELGTRYVEQIIANLREAIGAVRPEEDLGRLVRRLIAAQADLLRRSPALRAIHDVVVRLPGGPALAAAMEDALTGHVEALLAAHAPGMPAGKRRAAATFTVTTVHAVLERTVGMPDDSGTALRDAMETALVRYLAPYGRGERAGRRGRAERPSADRAPTDGAGEPAGRAPSSRAIPRP